MAKKSKKRKSSPAENPAPVTGNSRVISKAPEISPFWVAVIIPVICLVGAWTFPPVATPMELKSYTSQIYLSGLLFFWLWSQRRKISTTLSFSSARIAFGILFVAGTLSLLWASNPDFWVYKWNKWYAGFVIFLLGLHISQTEKNTDTVLNLAILGGIIIAAIGASQYLFGFNLLPQTSPPSSTFGNGNMAGQVMVLVTPLPLYFLFKEKISSGNIWYYTLALCLLLTYTFYTRTRAVWLASMFEISLIALFTLLDKSRRATWLHWRREKTRAAITALGLFFILINFNSEGFLPFWQVATYELSSIVTSIGTSAEQTGGERYMIWTVAFHMIKDSPFIGTGLGSFFDVYNAGGYANYRILGVQRVHNDVFELVVELGLTGFLILLGIIVTMCVLLYKLVQHSDGRKRITFALLTIAVTASMMNAQLSFPYQLPVPLVIMPLYVALLIRGYEDLGGKVWKVSPGPWFKKASLSLAGLLFAFIMVNDLAWFRDIRELNKIVAGDIRNTTWKPVNPIYNQAYLTATRSVAQAVRSVENGPLLALHVVEPILEYWPENATNAMLAVENYFALGNYEEAENWAKRARLSEPDDSYIAEYFLMGIFQQKGDMERLKALYESMKQQPESSLSRYQNTYNIMHSMSINVQDFEMTPYYFDKYQEYFGESASVIANHAVYFLAMGDIPAAKPYMKRALELDTNIALATQFKQILAQYPDQ